MNSNYDADTRKEMAKKEMARRELERRKNSISNNHPEMINTLIGQLPKDVNSQMIGNQDLMKNIIETSVGGPSTETISGITKLTNKNIIKDILDISNRNKEKYKVLYKDLFNEAKDTGHDNIGNISEDIDYKTLEKYLPEKKLEKIQKLKENPTNETAHFARSDLIKLKNELDKKTTLIGGEETQYKAISDAIKQLNKGMFKNESGNINPDLINKYNKISKGYAEEVVPYKENKDIKKYLRKKMLDSELIEKLSKGEFAAQVGNKHNIGKRKFLESILKYGGIPAMVGAVGAEGFKLGYHGHGE